VIKEALQYLHALARPETVTVDGRQYSTKGLTEIMEPTPSTVNVRTLTGLKDFLTANVDRLDLSKLIVHVDSECEVRVYSELFGPFVQRRYHITAKPDLLKMRFGEWIDNESFLIFLQACFLDEMEKAAGADGVVPDKLPNDRATLIRLASCITESGVKISGDDGVSQEVTVRQGIIMNGDERVPNPVTLRPFRTFCEVEQPTSRFVFRVRKGPECLLVEADGGAWRNEARENIKAWLLANLPTIPLDDGSEYPMTVIA
jgi:hypothetical protein